MVQQLARHLYDTAWNLWSSNIHAGSKVYDTIADVRTGDLVFERSSVGRKVDPFKCIGRLIGVREELIRVVEGGEVLDGEEWTDRFWYIERLDEHVTRWSNCGFLRIPEDTFDFVRNHDPLVEAKRLREKHAVALAEFGKRRLFMQWVASFDAVHREFSKECRR